MGVLSNLAIAKALDEGRLVITPRPTPGPGEPDSPYATMAVDLQLAPSLLIAKEGVSVAFDLRRGKIAPTLDLLCREVTIPPEGYNLEPNKFVLGRTVERVELPIAGALAARVEGRSSFARTGLLVHFTAPTIHTAFDGTITLEIINLGPASILLWPKMRLCQLIVETVEGEIATSGSQFRGQTKISGTRA